MEKEKRDKLHKDAIDFLYELYRLGVIHKELNEELWMANFIPPYYVLYLNYLNHYYFEVSKDEIDELIVDFVNLSFDSNQNLIDKMIMTNRQVDSLINTYRSGGLDYAAGWGASFENFFGDEPNVETCIKISELAYKMTADRREIKPELWDKKTQFVDIAKNISRACSDVLETKHNVSIPKEYFDGFGLYCTKWFCRYELSKNILGRDMKNWIDRSFVTQYFILLIIEDFFNDKKTYSGTKCFTMWNHMNKFNETVLGKENSLLNAIMLFVSTNLENCETEKMVSITKDVYEKVADSLRFATIRY